MKTFFHFLLLAVLPLVMSSCLPSAPTNPEKIVLGSWTHYKNTFIRDGRVIRPQNHNDTVSEGQAYGMLRAVLMNDQITFDKCLSWTETVLSRKASHGDRLLAWHFEHGTVSDTTAASDADIDYAYSLILAYRKWHDARYLQLASEVLQSVLDQETMVINGKLYFLPWPKKEPGKEELVAQNLSYYAPSHFKLFYEVTGDKRWLELADTTYDLLIRLLSPPGELKEGSLVPDWIALDQTGKIRDLPGKPVIYGWDAVRVPLRIAADYYLYGDQRALGVLRLFSASFEKEYHNDFINFFSLFTNGRTHENALFYSAIYAATETAGSSIAPAILQRLRNCIRQKGEIFYYNTPDDYYVNSLSWLTEYYEMNKSLNNKALGGTATERKSAL
ncbi:MAG: endoglucanase [Chlorobium sp.]|nr:MAG: endoglucanase [Chlorobium sp.]